VVLEKLKFIDESGCHLGLTRPYGWARQGEACVFEVPGNTGERQSVVGLFTTSGMEAHAVESGSLTGATFCAFLSAHVVPRLVPGDRLIVDNARCHHVKKVRELVEGAGAVLVYLPAYSPDFAPIELGWRTVKSHLRAVEPRTKEALRQAIGEGVGRVTGEAAKAFFAHCGYPVAPPGNVAQQQ
jgi:transposase